MKEPTPTMAELVEQAARFRGDLEVPRDFITKALAQIERGEITDVDSYPTGRPSLKGAYEAARRLQEEMT